jgi:hypothetical protein
VNWIRVFTDLYRNLEWLNSFAELNELAMHKILKKLSKNSVVLAVGENGGKFP